MWRKLPRKEINSPVLPCISNPWFQPGKSPLLVFHASSKPASSSAKKSIISDNHRPTEMKCLNNRIKRHELTFIQIVQSLQCVYLTIRIKLSCDGVTLQKQTTISISSNNYDDGFTLNLSLLQHTTDGINIMNHMANL